jgi:hypothetical protein
VYKRVEKVSQESSDNLAMNFVCVWCVSIPVHVVVLVEALGVDDLRPERCEKWD